MFYIKQELPINEQIRAKEVQVIDENGEKITHAWFLGFAPFDEPEIAVAVLIENAGSGGFTAETARDIMAEYFGMNANEVTEDMTAIPSTQVQR